MSLRRFVFLGVVAGAASCSTGDPADPAASGSLAPVANVDPHGPQGPAEGGATGYDTPVICTSNDYWRGDDGSPLMHPGVGCIACHGAGARQGAREAEREAPSFTIAGTVFPTAHEPDDCNGTSSGVTVVITDATGRTHAVPTNGAGNFFIRTPIAVPFRAKVVAGARERAMGASQTSGDCNTCHTEKGANGAPGRIVAP